MKHLLSLSKQTSIKQTINTDGVICYPTEAVWGLGCHPQSSQAFEKILSLKQRPIDKGVILVASDYDQLKPYVLWDDLHKSQLANWWPGFVTCLLPTAPTCPSYLKGKHQKIAVRLSHHPLIRELCQLTQTALVSTSANLSGNPPVHDLEEAKQTFSDGVDYYLDADLGGEKKPSRIIELINQQIIVHRD